MAEVDEWSPVAGRAGCAAENTRVHNRTLQNVLPPSPDFLLFLAYRETRPSRKRARCLMAVPIDRVSSKFHRRRLASALTPLLAFAALFAVSAAAATNQWSVIGPPMPVSALGVDPQNDAVLYAAGQNMIARSADRGATWTTVDVPGLAQPIAVRVAVSIPGTVYALGYGSLFRSTNGGISWAPRTLPTAGQFQSDLQVAATNADTLVVAAMNFCFFGCSGGGVYRSDNGGGSWRSIGFKNKDIRQVALDPTTPQIVYAATETSLFRTSNGGGSWTDISPPAGGRIQSVAVDSQIPSTVYAATDSGLSRSDDSGRTWELTRPTPWASLITTASGNSRRLFGSVEGLALSLDGGRTWQELRSRAPGIEFRSLEQVVAGHDVYFIVADLATATGQVLEYEPVGPRRRSVRK
jgi:photosystem II stability/assembly factor-like uncharacterized protein